MDRIYKLKGVVQNYSWGGTTYIPELLGFENPEQKPCGEYWLGAHPAAPSVIEEGNQKLDAFIAAHVNETLGEDVAKAFGSLPYLFKILDVRQMLSIQVHPSKEAAEKAFEEENQRGIPLTAPTRNYKDKNHKPELMVALSEFYLLHGFKPKEELVAIINKVPELHFLIPAFNEGDYEALYEAVMALSQQQVDEILKSLINRIVPAYQQDQLSKETEDFWAARAATSFCKNGHYDRGIFSIYLFNLLKLSAGEAIYQPAGLPHAYLQGQNVEVMANSDNVLRAGLTDKHVDVTELMKHVKFEPTVPNIIRAAETEQQSFATPAKEFLLSRHATSQSIHLKPATGSILFVQTGEGSISDGVKKISLNRGDAVFLLPAERVVVEPLEGEITVFIVTTPLDKI